MNQELQQAWLQLLESVAPQQNVSALAVGAHMLVAGIAGLYLRVLYQRYSLSASDSDAITRVFPLLTVITTAVIGVVKASLALSLGFVGALALVRFRSAIKEPEELVYLFLCVAVGLALGAEAPLLAVLLVSMASVLAWIMHFQGRRGRSHSLLLTITGDSENDFCEGPSGVFSVVSELVGPHTVQRLDVDNGHGQIRLVLRRADPAHAARLVIQLKRRLPGCEFSYMNLNSSL